MMNAAAPEATPPRWIGDERFKKKILCPPCLGEALMRLSIVRQFLWFWFERYEFMPVSTAQKNVLFLPHPVSMLM
jgi:hypothetical protein